MTHKTIKGIIMENKWHIALVTGTIFWTALGIIFSLSYLLVLMLGGVEASEVALLKAVSVTGMALIADDVVRLATLRASRWSKMGLALTAMWTVIAFLIPDGAFESITRLEAIAIITMPMISVTGMIKYINSEFQKRTNVVAA